MAKTIKHKSYQGITGYSLESFIEFLTGDKPIKAKEEEKTLIFYIADSHLCESKENEKMRSLLMALASRYGIKIKKISEL